MNCLHQKHPAWEDQHFARRMIKKFSDTGWDVSLLGAVMSQISIVDGGMLDDLEQVARSVRRCKQPFGGLQLVLTGDFHQLPPVAKGRQAMAGAASINRCAI